MPAPLPLTRQRCWNHAEREAAARCPSCARFYCRECVTEHAGRMMCAACLRAQFAADEQRRRRPGGGRLRRVLRSSLAGTRRAAQVGAGIVAAWFFFHLVAQWLVSLPENFHEGTFWKQSLLGGSDE